MNVRFYVDPETEAPHIYNRGIDEEEVIDVLSSPRVQPAIDLQSSRHPVLERLSSLVSEAAH
jgi:hypothetical protein